MIASIVVTGCYNIRQNTSKKIKVDDNILSIEKDIPFVRYRFDSYSDTEISYIEKMKQQFNRSTHLVEIQLMNDGLAALNMISNKFCNSLAKYVYVDITDETLQAGLSEDIIEVIKQASSIGVDRIMFKDKSSMLDAVSASNIIKNVSKEIKEPSTKFGICSSPLSFGDYACLTAVKARELMSLYSTIEDVALPSSNHQCMNCCGCIRYIVVNSDTEAPAETKQKVAKKKCGETSNSSKESSAKKASAHNNTGIVVNPGMFRL